MGRNWCLFSFFFWVMHRCLTTLSKLALSRAYHSFIGSTKHCHPTTIVHRGSLDGFGDSCISLLRNHVLACISIAGVKKLPIFLHKTIAIWPTDQMHQKLKSPSISLCLPTQEGVYGVRERDCPTVHGSKNFGFSNSSKYTKTMLFYANFHICPLKNNHFKFRQIKNVTMWVGESCVVSV